MFTGLVREIGRIRALSPGSSVVRLDLEAPVLAGSIELGQSVAVNGICLTVTRTRGRIFSVEAATETRRLTTLSSWRRGDQVHLEPALRAGEALDGHLVQGHVDGIGRVLTRRRAGRDLLLTVGCDPQQARFLTAKGSVALDGVSLTVDEGPFQDRFTVNLIPHTLQQTLLGKLRAGAAVNLEMDVLVKAARSGQGWPGMDFDNESPAGNKPTGLTMERILARGFGRRARKGRS